MMFCCSYCPQAFTDNPLTEFVEVPDEYRDLRYCNLLCGVIRGALEQVSRQGHQVPMFPCAPRCPRL